MDGFEATAKDIEQLASRATDETIIRKALKNGANPIVDRAKRNATQVMRRRTGRLVNSTRDEYNPKEKTQVIGWSGEGFYGRFHEYGYRPRPGIRLRRGDTLTWKNSRKNPQGRTVQNPHLRPAYEAEKDNAGRNIVQTLQKELGGT
ncbi:MAG: HK97 gp10 family phage protein [Defluviitaleaceae bacterium]|nr:HK97 gp10 family phage protein [Defluviitaleaceae bacterium]